ncbi:DUF2061 domain-containing protein [Pseudidiomarina marina]|uniref:DUF2061 domain-containing protein n=1 Tax=Pseudidiomarina marina TaxID=502366 RepID=A0A432YLC6_9GAMM|nr:DUF2061 domain-containing protein [Pseudidiomarina marina]PHR63521.1 MAG: DUF2061 domain-containing protein [Idiomarina sp.]RUO61763.1 DUF2061 domain-containing protein [Pseudidiomarina marina]
MAKTVSFGVMHVSVAFTLVWLMTGDIVLGGAVALIEPVVNTVAYYFHEKFWAARQMRRQSRQNDAVHVA